MSWYLGAFKKYATFSGRARRKEYWMFFLFNFIFALLLSILTLVHSAFDTLYYIYYLAIIIPSLALTVRRLHDIGKNGWFILLGLIPVVGFIILIVFHCLEGVRGSNQYGEDPKQSSSTSY
ncbi:DUF805 domain-containing protein [Paenibacillus sp. GCM10027627]|uniref:DUF805 domain-containing protein n=1 Tax=unclassified Paenibacillus TaxID=185978 RepID=UPI0036428176